MQNKGFTIIEMMVVVTLFSILVAAASGLFVSSLKIQRTSLAVQELLDQSSYSMEYMTRALRMARKDLDGSCTGTSNLNYAFVGQCIYFRSYSDTCQEFCLEGTVLKDINDVELTSDNIKVMSFDVILSGQVQPPADFLQPRTTLFLNVLGKENSHINLQATVSQRNLDIRR
ncbi:MAG: prepilin-type N-terminal cleavage/methylation domain-containing protein [Candidatus Nealsonbacteria bacterium]